MLRNLLLGHATIALREQLGEIDETRDAGSSIPPGNRGRIYSARICANVDTLGSGQSRSI